MAAVPAAAGTGVSLGTVILVGGIVIAAGVLYYVAKSKKKSESKAPIRKLLSDEDRYATDKEMAEKAISEKDWETLEDMLDSSTADFPDLIKMIEEALQNK